MRVMRSVENSSFMTLNVTYQNICFILRSEGRLGKTEKPNQLMSGRKTYVTRCTRRLEWREGMKRRSRLERGTPQLSRNSGDGNKRRIWRVGKEVGLTELGHRFYDLDAGRQGKGMTPRQRTHVCKDIETWKGITMLVETGTTVPKPTLWWEFL